MAEFMMPAIVTDCWVASQSNCDVITPFSRTDFHRKLLESRCDLGVPTVGAIYLQLFLLLLLGEGTFHTIWDVWLLRCLVCARRIRFRPSNAIELGIISARTRNNMISNDLTSLTDKEIYDILGRIRDTIKWSKTRELDFGCWVQVSTLFALDQCRLCSFQILSSALNVLILMQLSDENWREIVEF